VLNGPPFGHSRRGDRSTACTRPALRRLLYLCLPVQIMQNPGSDCTQRISQLRPRCSFSRSALGCVDDRKNLADVHALNALVLTWGQGTVPPVAGLADPRNLGTAACYATALELAWEALAPLGTRGGERDSDQEDGVDSDGDGSDQDGEGVQVTSMPVRQRLSALPRLAAPPPTDGDGNYDASAAAMGDGGDNDGAPAGASTTTDDFGMCESLAACAAAGDRAGSTTALDSKPLPVDVFRDCKYARMCRPLGPRSVFSSRAVLP